MRGAAFANALAAKHKTLAQPSGYCTNKNLAAPFSNQKTCPSGKKNDISTRIELLWHEADNNVVYKFWFGLDFGLGAAFFIDGKAHADVRNIWWSGNIDNAIVVPRRLNRGHHNITIFGVENCCDGD